MISALLGATTIAALFVAGCDCSVDTPHLALTKSFSQALHDCMEYLQVPGYRYAEYAANCFPDDPETKCLLRCVGLNLRWWNDTTGVQSAVMARFFQPDPVDVEYTNRTAVCLQQALIRHDASDCCCLAYESFLCYLLHYGNLVPCAQFIPEDESRDVRAARDCMDVLQIPQPMLRAYGKGSFPDAPETRCLLRCFFLRTGVYHVEGGFDVNRLYARDYEQPDERYLAADTLAKLRELHASMGDQCTEAYLAYRDVLAQLGRPFYEERVLRAAAAKLVHCDAHVEATTKTCPTTTTTTTTTTTEATTTVPSTTTTTTLETTTKYSALQLRLDGYGPCGRAEKVENAVVLLTSGVEQQEHGSTATGGGGGGAGKYTNCGRLDGGCSTCLTNGAGLKPL
uniref:Odorant-binding protein n=1 Tax=Anopheles farauti TaxID=69004 RepID=A0A182QU73_9DIPT